MKVTAKGKSAFTLVELMVVVAITGVLAAVAIPSFINYIKWSKTTEARTNLQVMFTAAAAYYEEEHWTQGLVTSGKATANHSCTVAQWDYTDQGLPTQDKQVLNYAAEPSAQALHFIPPEPLYYVYHVFQSTGTCENTA